DKSKRSSTFFGTRQDTTNWNIGLSKGFQSGTRTSIDWSNQRIRLFGVPTINGANIFPTEPTYESTVSFSVTQPLLKNFAGKVDRASVDSAKHALEGADRLTKHKMNTIAYRALLAYWQLAIAYNNVAAWKLAVLDAQKFYDISLERKNLGTAEETDVLAAEANLINRKNGLSEAEIIESGLENELKIILGYDSADTLRPADKDLKFIHSDLPHPDDFIAAALAKRGDYLAQKAEVEKSEIVLVSAKNKRWPELDLTGTFALNELKTSSYTNTLGDIDSPSWTVGMQLSYPLENRTARAEKKKSQHEKAKAVIQLKNLENEITNTCTELISRLKKNIEVVNNSKEAESLQRKKLSLEADNYKLGRSSSEVIIRYQDDRLFSRQAEFKAWGEYFTTVLDVEFAQNSILDL
ncbi:MAG: TolC family protein, partial [Deltaproteobacteria bacterium]|nr:TolC family protein [Deltaproteobacteria bacterium]